MREYSIPGEHLADWQLWLGTFLARWLLFMIEMIGLGILIATVTWAIAGGWHWSGLLKVGIGLVACRITSWFAAAAHPLAVALYNEFNAPREARLRERDTRGYFLFLRSFRDDVFATRQTSTVEGSTTTVMFDNLSELLERGLEDYGRLIMIGAEPSADPLWDTSVLARSDDESWWSLLQRLLTNARCVFVVPETSPGLLREFAEVLREEHRSKAVIVMPRADQQGEREQRWEQVRTELRHEGFDLPAYNPAGCFYTPDRQLRPVRTFPFSSTRTVPGAMRRAFRAIDASLPRGTTPLNEALGWIDIGPGLFPVAVAEVLKQRFSTQSD